MATNKSVLLDLQICQKSQLSCAQWNSAFQDLLKAYPNHLKVYTDGSKINGKTGSGVWSTDFILKARLPDDCSVYSAELFAIYSALKYIERINHPTLILSDSLTSIMALRSTRTSSNYLIGQIILILNNYPNRL